MSFILNIALDEHPTKDFRWVNKLVAATNLAFLVPVYAAAVGGQTWTAVLCLFAGVASVLYHLAERKHGLPGCRWRRHWIELLWLDRVGAYMLFVCLVHRAIALVPVGQWPIVQLGIGFLCLGLSEWDDALVSLTWLHNKQTAFALLHGVWHVCAAWSASEIVSWSANR